jgi:hypothetical protein
MPRGDIDHELGGLGEVPRALGMLWGHEADYETSQLARKHYSELPYSN